jgi:nitrogen regulatory protein PII
MQTHVKKRIELFIEAPLLRRVLERFDKAGVTGYSVMPVVAGRGQTGSWTADGQVGSAGGMYCVVCIVDPANADGVLTTIYESVSRQIGIVSMSDVAVVRSARF